MKNKKKGFTLIELLAVIVILAIIALIAVPTIMGIINKANKSAFKDTAYGIINAAELYFAEQQLELNGMENDKTFDLSTDVNVEGGLQLKGEVPKTGTLIVNTEGKIALAVSNGRYCITKEYSDKDITLIDNYTECYIKGPQNITYNSKNTLTLLNSLGKDLIDYKLYGNTIDGKSLGDYDETTGRYKISVKISGKNLFDINSVETVDGCEVINNGVIYNAPGDFDIKFSAGQYTISFDNNGVGSSYIRNGKVKSGYIIEIKPTDHMRTFNYTASVDGYLRISSFSTGQALSNIQIEEGNTATDYEVYREPITTNIYLDEPLGSSDYIDFGKQKVIRNGASKSIELPNIQTIEGTTILKVLTEIQPSNIEVTYKGHR